MLQAGAANIMQQATSQWRVHRLLRSRHDAFVVHECAMTRRLPCHSRRSGRPVQHKSRNRPRIRGSRSRRTPQACVTIATPAWLQAPSLEANPGAYVQIDGAVIGAACTVGRPISESIGVERASLTRARASRHYPIKAPSDPVPVIGHIGGAPSVFSLSALPGYWLGRQKQSEK